MGTRIRWVAVALIVTVPHIHRLCIVMVAMILAVIAVCKVRIAAGVVVGGS